MQGLKQRRVLLLRKEEGLRRVWFPRVIDWHGHVKKSLQSSDVGHVSWAMDYCWRNAGRSPVQRMPSRLVCWRNDWEALHQLLLGWCNGQGKALNVPATRLPCRALGYGRFGVSTLTCMYKWGLFGSNDSLWNLLKSKTTLQSFQL